MQQEDQEQQLLQLQQEQRQQQQQLSTAPDDGVQEEEPVLEHINFWKELETKAQHPERQVRWLSDRSSSSTRGTCDGSSSTCFALG